MKGFFLLIALLIINFSAKADQLAYLSKADAERAATFIRTQKSIYLFCGCCENETPVKFRVKRVEVRYTGFEDYYEVVVYNKKKGGESNALDLAYSWFREYKKKYLTIGAFLGLDHDPCKQFPGSWT